MSRVPTWIGAVLAALLAPAARAQDPSPVEPPAPPAVTPAAPDPGPRDDGATHDPELRSAASIFDEAAKRQNAAAIGGKVDDFSVRLRLTRDDASGRFTADVERRYKAPDRLWTRVREETSHADYVEGHDGKLAWHKSDVLTIYDPGDPDFRTDRKRVADDLATMRLLMRFMFLENLKPELHDLRRLPDVKDEDRAGNARDAYVLTARADPDEKRLGQVRLTFTIDKNTADLVGASMLYEDQPERATTFCFWKHRPNSQGVMIPGRINVYEHGSEVPSQELVISGKKLEGGGVGNDMEFNTGLDETVFAPPQS